MDDRHFLAALYTGSLDRVRFDSFPGTEPDEKTRQMISRFESFTKEFPPSLLEKEGRIPDELMKMIKDSGFFGLSIPARYGGLGLDLVQYLKVVEEIAAGDMAVAIVGLAHLSIGIKGIVLFGNEEQKRRYLGAAATGKLVFSYALTEPMHGSDAKNIETTATLSDDGQSYILNGQKTYITNAGYAGAMTVFAQLDPERPGHMGAFVVETSLDGVSIGKDITKMGLKASSTAAVKFKDVRVPAANMLGSPGDGFKIAMNILNYGRMALGAASAGMMRRSLKDMQKRAANRRQFGLAIREFELIQEKMIRASVYAEIAYSMTGFTAGMLMDDPLASVAMESSHCKLFGTTRAWDVLYDALQVSGGSGYLATLPYEKRMRDFRVATVFEGTTEIHSIYPPLYFIRKVSELLKSRKKGKLGSLLYLTGEMLSLRRLSVTAGEGKELKRAASFARKCAARIKFLLHAAMIFYGKRVVRREFFLRRVATMSIYLYGSVSMLARIKKLGREGKDSTRERLILDCFVKEGAGFLKNAPGLRPTGLERAGARLMRHLEQG